MAPHRPLTQDFPMPDACHFTNGLSRLMLGTVQWGQPYGVANRTGQPSYGTVVEMLEVALAGGVNACDTAAAYGTSEEVLGQAIRERGWQQHLSVVTKVQPLSPAELADPALGRAAVERSVERSLRRLSLARPPLVLFHRECDAVFLDVLIPWVERGSLAGLGVSCDHAPGPPRAFAADPRIRALQVPANLLDHRHRRGGTFQAAADHGVALWVRSVYLQGLLQMPEQQVPPALAAVVPLRRALQQLASDAGVTLGELAFRYLLAQPEVTSLVIGVETVAQVRDNLRLVARGPLSADTCAAIEALDLTPPETLITPRLWPPVATV